MKRLKTGSCLISLPLLGVNSYIFVVFDFILFVCCDISKEQSMLKLGQSQFMKFLSSEGLYGKQQQVPVFDICCCSPVYLIGQCYSTIIISRFSWACPYRLCKFYICKSGSLKPMGSTLWRFVLYGLDLSLKLSNLTLFSMGASISGLRPSTVRQKI